MFLGRTRATLSKSASLSCTERRGESSETSSCWGLIFEILDQERGISSKHKSAAVVDYMLALCTHRLVLPPIEWFNALCTHRPLLLRIEWFSEILGLELSCSAMNEMDSGKLLKLDHLEEVKVVLGNAVLPPRGIRWKLQNQSLSRLNRQRPGLLNIKIAVKCKP